MNIYYSLTYTFLCIICKNNKNLVKCVDPIPGEQNQENTANSSKSSYEYPHGIKIITEGSKVPNDASKFEFRTSEPDEGHFIFRKKAHCTEVRADATLWKGRSGDRYPSAISYDSNEISINFPDKLLVFKKENGTWQSSEHPNKTLTSPEFTGSTSKTNEPRPFTHIDPKHKIFNQLLKFDRFNLENFPDLKRQLHSLNKIKLIDLLTILVNKVMGLEDSYNFHSFVDDYFNLYKDFGPVGINIKLPQSHRFDRTVDPNTKVVTFRCKQDQPFSLVKKGDMVIWHTLSPREYLYKVEMSGDMLTLYDLNGNFKVVPIEPLKESKTISHTEQSVRTDNITSQTGGPVRRDSLDLYGFNQNNEALPEDKTDNIDIFDHNNSYTLYKVTDDTRFLWTPLFDDKFIELYYQRTSEGKILLGIYFITEVFGFQDPAEYQFPIELNYVTLDVENKEPTIFIDYFFDTTYNTHDFTPRFPYLINSIVKGGEPIWKIDTDDDVNRYPLSVGFKENGTVYIDYDDHYYKYTKNHQGVWSGERRLYTQQDEQTDAIKMVDDNSSGEDDSSSEEDEESGFGSADDDEFGSSSTSIFSKIGTGTKKKKKKPLNKKLSRTLSNLNLAGENDNRDPKTANGGEKSDAKGDKNSNASSGSSSGRSFSLGSISGIGSLFSSSSTNYSPDDD